MRRPWHAVLVSGALLAGLWLGAARVAPVHAGATSELEPKKEAAPVYDPKKKKPGDACKSSDECQKHHTCAKVGDKNVCQAPPRPPLPPGVVT